MATVIFYEKPGCINNAKQRALLLAAGHTVQTHNLLKEEWTIEKLRLFFNDLPVPDWFNRTAPLVKSGEVNPDQIDATTALQLMIVNPLLIRRPLMQVNDQYMVGFDTEQVDLWLGLRTGSSRQQPLREVLLKQDLQTCPNQQTAHALACGNSETSGGES